MIKLHLCKITNTYRLSKPSLLVQARNPSGRTGHDSVTSHAGLNTAGRSFEMTLRRAPTLRERQAYLLPKLYLLASLNNMKLSADLCRDMRVEDSANGPPHAPMLGYVPEEAGQLAISLVKRVPTA